MIFENNANFLKLAKLLGREDDPVVRRVREQVEKYDPVQIGESGQIKEFREEKRDGDIGEYHHRHLSQLVGLYPGTLISSRTPDLLAAAKVSLTSASALFPAANCRESCWLWRWSPCRTS